MKRIGIMGCGVVASYGHGPAIRETQGLELAAAFDPNPLQLDLFLRHFPEAKGYTEPEAFFESGIDAVAVTSPVPYHLDNVRMAARYGKSPAQLVIRWNLQLGVVPLPKANHAQHQRENMNVFDFEISQPDMAKLRTLNEHYSAMGMLSYT